MSANMSAVDDPVDTKPGLARVMASRPEIILSPLLFFALLGAWYLATRLFTIPEFVLPSPGKVWASLVSGLTAAPLDPAGYWFHMGVTASESVLGFLIGSSAGIVT